MISAGFINCVHRIYEKGKNYFLLKDFKYTFLSKADHSSFRMRKQLMNAGRLLLVTAKAKFVAATHIFSAKYKLMI
jgi:hypothetical protein